MAKLLSLSDSARTIVYETIVAALKADATLAGCTPAISWATFTDEADQPGPDSGATLPNISVLPFGPDAEPQSQTQQQSPLGIHILVTTSGLDVRDLLNLWGAIEGSLFTGDGGNTLRNAANAAISGAGLPVAQHQFISARLKSPAIAVHEDPERGGHCQAAGQVVVTMLMPK